MLKRLFLEGALLSATIVAVPMQADRWIIICDTASGKRERITKSRTDLDKVYKRINTAVDDVKKIGFKEVKIKLQ